MASSPSIQRAPSGGPAAGDSTSFSRTRDWGRPGDPGAAFNGLTKARDSRRGGGGGGRSGRGGRAGGRGGPTGGRGGGGGGGSGEGGRGSRPPADAAPTANAPKPQVKERPAPPPVSAEKTAPPPSNSKAATPATPNKPKPSRRASRGVPPALVVSATPSVEAPPATPSSRPSNRRKRSNTMTKAQGKDGVGKNVPAPLDSTLLSPNKGGRPRNGAHSAPHTGMIKDIPPHMIADKRNDIDALVEHMRSVAMDNNRPSTPGSHIDWAGEEDDSLPDLDDWGVQPKSALSGSFTAEPQETWTAEPVSTKPQASTATAVPEAVPSDAPSASPKEAPPAAVEQSPPSVSPSRSPVSDSSSKEKGKEKAPAKAHPSLPPKPVQTQDLVLTKSLGATPMRNTLLRGPPTAPRGMREEQPKPAEAKAEEGVEKTEATPPASSPKASETAEAPAPAKEPSLPAKPEIIEPEQPAEDRELTSLEKRLSSPPKPNSALRPSSSSPSDLSTHSNPSSNSATAHAFHGHQFQPGHNRSHTVGRPPFRDFDRERGGYALNSRFSRSGNSTPRAMDGYHARTHSSPPTGTHRMPHARPVITGDAISRLARTIGQQTKAVPAVAGAAKE